MRRKLVKPNRTSKGKAYSKIPYLAKTLFCRISRTKTWNNYMFHDFTKYHVVNESTCSANCFAASGAAISSAAFCIFFCTTSSPNKTTKTIILRITFIFHMASQMNVHFVTTFPSLHKRQKNERKHNNLNRNCSVKDKAAKKIKHST